MRIPLLFASKRREDPYQQSAKLQNDIKLITIWILQNEVMRTRVTKKQEANTVKKRGQGTVKLKSTRKLSTQVQVKVLKVDLFLIFALNNIKHSNSLF